jgi:3-dehydroquinate synthase
MAWSKGPHTMTSFDTISVGGDAHRPYDVIIGPGLTGELQSRIPTDVRKILITHPPVLHARAEVFRDVLADGREVFLAEIPDGESAKRVEVASFLWGLLGQLEFGRGDLIIGFGGGSTTDLAGFVAATWLRGIRVIHIPTTVLGMVDAAVGGKTGINTAEGKNLVGSFHAPTLVACDTDYLATLPENDIKAGLAEVVKCGFIKDPAILDLVEKNPEAIITPGSDELAEAIGRAVRVKAHVVGSDFLESGVREILNYGHTLGHAIEHAERYKWRHGAAISIGMVFAAELSRIVAGLDDVAVDRHRSLLGSLGLPLDYPAARWQTLLATMQRDKKSRQGVLRFVVLDQIGSARVLAIPDESVLFAAYEELVAGQSV